MKKGESPSSSPHQWTDKQIYFLKEFYPQKGKMWCCNYLGLKEHQIRTKASQLHLVLDKEGEFYKNCLSEFACMAKSRKGIKRPYHGELVKRMWKEGKFPERKKQTKNCIICGIEFVGNKRSRKTCSQKCCGKLRRSHPHPRGFKGKKRSNEWKENMSIISKKRWNNPNNKLRSEEYAQIRSDRMVSMHKNGTLGQENSYSRCKRGWFIDGDKKYFMRSSWEINYACYLNFLIKCGEIKGWEYEVDTFWFENIRRGVRSYTPDFKIETVHGTYEYHEVKGWMDPKSKTKLKRMAKYYPNTKIIIIDTDQYREIMKNKKLFGIYE